MTSKNRFRVVTAVSVSIAALTLLALKPAQESATAQATTIARANQLAATDPEAAREIQIPVASRTPTPTKRTRVSNGLFTSTTINTDRAFQLLGSDQFDAIQNQLSREATSAEALLNARELDVAIRRTAEEIDADIHIGRSSCGDEICLASVVTPMSEQQWTNWMDALRRHDRPKRTMTIHDSIQLPTGQLERRLMMVTNANVLGPTVHLGSLPTSQEVQKQIKLASEARK